MDGPVSATTLSGVTVCISGFPTRQKETLHRMIGAMVCTSTCPNSTASFLTFFFLPKLNPTINDISSFPRASQGGTVSKALTSAVTHVVAKNWASQKAQVIFFFLLLFPPPHRSLTHTPYDGLPYVLHLPFVECFGDTFPLGRTRYSCCCRLHNRCVKVPRSFPSSFARDVDRNIAILVRCWSASTHNCRRL